MSLRGPATREEKTPRCDCNWFRPTGKSRAKNKVRDCPRRAPRTFSYRALGSIVCLLSWGSCSRVGQPFLQCRHADCQQLAYRGPTCNNTAVLLPSRYLWRNEADVIDSRLMADIEHVRHGREVQFRISLDEHHLLRPGGENTFQLIQ